MSRSDAPRDGSAPLLELLGWIARCKRRLSAEWAYWCSGTPSLESDIALAGMALEEEGHRLAIEAVLVEFGGAPTVPPDGVVRWRDWRAQGGLGFAPPPAWPATLAAGLALDTLAAVALAPLRGCAHARLAQRASRILQEERVHRGFVLETLRALTASGVPAGGDAGLYGVHQAAQGDLASAFDLDGTLARLVGAGFITATDLQGAAALGREVDARLVEALGGR